MKRFSKIVSVIMPVPFATRLSSENCACISVGKPGCGAVRIFTAVSSRSVISRLIQSSPLSTNAPASSSFASTASISSGLVLRQTILPPETAAATRKVPVSIRSATTSW